MSNNDTTLSKTITFLRFPLIVAVVFIHTILLEVIINGNLLVSEGEFPIHDLICHVISGGLAQIAVPLFYFISGFLFFYHSDFSLRIYGQKLKKRVRTLLVPYLFWNIVVFLLTLATQLLLSSMTSGRHKLIVDYNWMDWLNLFWNYAKGMPVCYQFWFIRDLMIVCLFTPIIYWIIKYGKVYGILLLGGLWMFNLWPSVTGLSVTAFFFFSWGAWFGIHRRDFTESFHSLRWGAACLYIVLLTISTWLWHSQITDYPFVHKVGIIVGIVAVVSWTAYGFERKQLHASTFLAGSAFFVYAYHGMLITLIIKYWVKLLSPHSEWTMIIGYFLIPTVIVVLGIALYALLRKYFPAFTAVITGGR